MKLQICIKKNWKVKKKLKPPHEQTKIKGKTWLDAFAFYVARREERKLESFL